MSIAIKTCSACGQANPAFHDFCPTCGASIRAAEPRTLTWTAAASVQLPPIPDALDPDRLRRLRQPVPEGRGVGLIWVGALLIFFPVLINTRSTVAIAGWGAGILIALAGFWQMRRDKFTLGRAGLGVNAAALLALAVIAAQVHTSAQHAAAPAAPTPTATAVPDWTAANAAAATPEVAMYLGGAAHTGALPGPGITGRPFRTWRFETSGELYSSPAVVNGTLYVGSKSGFLYALDATTGAQRWSVDLGDYIVRASPAVADGRVYIGSGTAVYALDAATGERLWQANTAYTGSSSPTVVDGMVYIASQASEVYGIDAATGKIVWTYTTDGPVFSAPTVASGVVLVGTDSGKLLALSTKTGAVQWRYEAGSGVFSSPAVVGNLAYVTTRGGQVVALDIATGEKRWSYDAGGDASPAVAQGLVFVGTNDGGLYAIDAAKGGEPAWLFPTGGAIVAAPIVANGLVYVASGTTLYAIDLTTGQERWRYGAGYQIQTPPVVIGGYVYIGGRNGYLDAISGDGTG